MSNFKTFKLESWNHFFEITKEMHSLGNQNPYWSFRGQSDSNWSLNSSLARILKSNSINHPLNAFKIEGSLTRYFLANNKHFDELKNVELKNQKNNIVQIWSFMQHYGAPTRLLDWTDSPLIGLYYAVEGNWSKDGVLYMINNRTINEASDKKFGSFNLAEDFEKNFSNSIVPIKTSPSTRRSNNQQGLFTISNNPLLDQKEAIDDLEIEPNSVYKLIIPRNLKIELLRRLRSSNVKADILFPDAFGLGKELNNLAILRSNEI